MCVESPSFVSWMQIAAGENLEIKTQSSCQEARKPLQFHCRNVKTTILRTLRGPLTGPSLYQSDSRV